MDIPPISYQQLFPEDAGLSGNSLGLRFLFVQGANPPADPDCAYAIILYHIMCLAARPSCDNSTVLLSIDCFNSSSYYFYNETYVGHSVGVLICSQLKIKMGSFVLQYSVM